MASIAVLGTLDTKGEEHSYLAERIHYRGHETVLINVGTGGGSTVATDITREEVAAAGDVNLKPLLNRQDRGECVSAMGKAAPELVSKLESAGKIDGIISLGGGGGTAIATAAMRALPIGFPKVMVSTLAAGDISSYLGTKDIVMIPNIADISGLNRLSRLIFSRAVGAICGMVETKVEDSSSKPLIVASMFGNTTKCISEAREILEEAGYEVLDITTSELADELVVL